MATYKDLNEKDKSTLLKFPVYISLLAASHDLKLDSTEKKEALKLTHVRTFAHNPLLREYYSDVEKHFEENIRFIDNKLPQEKSERQEAIKKELEKVEEILKKMGKLYGETLVHSMKAYIDHVSKAHDNALGYFMFPFSIENFSN